ncbi:MAG: helix-turn-helix transcriptional regulator [Clostridia bacterium]|nr:helix-turn-helix transcriptional regulator [Clostridia bacterium]
MEKLTCDCNIIHHDTVNAAVSEKLKPREVEALSGIFKVLGDPTRIRILWALRGREMCVCDLGAALGMTKSAISHQLKTMKDAAIVKSRREGKNIFYSLDDSHVNDILDIAMVHVTHTK